MAHVRLKDDPGRRGQTVGEPRDRSDGLVYKIAWSDGITSWTPEYELEFLDDSDDDWVSLLRKKRFGRHSDLRRNLTFIQMSGRLADLIYSMDTTQTDFLAFQYKPVLTFLESPSNAILIADEVGLGKTIEAGLIWTELRARYDARRLLVVCPSMLRDKWKLELQSKFGIEASILSAGELERELRRNKGELRDGIAYICSLQGLRPPRDWRTTPERNDRTKLARLLDDLQGKDTAIDLLVIDEAHYLRNPETQSFRIGRMLREVSEHAVLLSATPVNNYEQDLFQLLRLVDPDSFQFKEQFGRVLSANEPLVQARRLALNQTSSWAQIREQLNEARRHPLLSGSRQLKDLLEQDEESGLSSYLSDSARRIALANRLERINLLRHTICRTRKSEVQELRVVREARSYFVPLDAQGPERQFYDRVTGAIRQYAESRGIGDGFLLSPPQRQMSSCMYAAARSWAERTWQADVEELRYEDLGWIELSEGEVGPLVQHIATEVLPGFNIESLRQQDSKFEKLQHVVRNYLDRHPGEKLIVFSYFKATLNYLSERLSELDVANRVLHGGTDDNKQDAIDQFRESGHVRVLLASEVASEGVDLQFCSVVINYDLPWNPMKVEQRIGRVDRIGQRSEKVLIWNIGHADTIDERIYKLLLQKLKIFERSLGGMEAVLGELMGTLASDLLSKQLTSEQETERINQTYLAVANNRQQQDELEANAAHLIAHGGYILDRIHSAHEFRRGITDQDIKVYVKDYLDRYAKGTEFREDDRDPLVAHIRLSPAVATQLEDYLRKARLFGQTRLATGDGVTCRFLNKISRAGARPEVVGQLHPLVRFINSDLRKRGEGFFPLVAVTIPAERASSFGEGVYAFAAKCWSFQGVRTEEELRAQAMELGACRPLDADQSWDMVNAAKLRGSDWRSASTHIAVTQLEQALDDCAAVLDREFQAAKRERDNENHDRVTLQRRTIESHRDRLLTTQSRLLARYKAEGRKPLVRLTQGKIDAVRRRYARRLERLEQQMNMSSHSRDVCFGVARVVR